MTEAEWLAAGDPFKMVWHPLLASERKLRLFACACVRPFMLIPDKFGCGMAFEVAERIADGLALPQERQKAELALEEGRITADDDRYFVEAVANLFESPIQDAVTATLDNLFNHNLDIVSNSHDEFYANQLRDIFGNPFHPVAIDPNRLTSTVVSLARSMYESRDFSTMPILSDALQDAGCENEVILNHCRSDGPHVRGCWVVDLLLGKE